MIKKCQDLNIIYKKYYNLLVMKEGLSIFFEVLLLSIQLFYFMWDLKLPEKHTSHKLPFN